MKRIEYLDGWRGCAVLAVLVAHFSSIYAINLGRFGVELFFVLSGRLMAEILFVRDTPLRRFFPRRFARVYPALLVFATLIYATSGWQGGDPTGAHFVSAITFTANYAQFWTGRSGMLDHIWSLCIEEHMYLLLGAVAFIHRCRPLPLIALFAGLAAIAIAIGVANTAAGLGYYEVYWRTDVRGASLLIGVIAYLVMQRYRPHVLTLAWTPLVLGVASLMLNFAIVPDPVKYSLGTLCLAFALVAMPAAPGRALRLLEHPLLLRIGVWSYSIYLWQQPFSRLGAEHGDRPVYLLAAILVALVSFYLVEQPARTLLNRLLERRLSPTRA